MWLVRELGAGSGEQGKESREQGLLGEYIYVSTKWRAESGKSTTR